MTTGRIAGIACAVPQYRFSQNDAMNFMRRWLDRAPASFELSIEKVIQAFENSGVESRYSVLPIDKLLEARTLGEKNRIYIEEARGLAEEAVAKLFSSASRGPEAIDLIITTSCTGFMIPSLDAWLVNRFAFRDDVRRMPLTELGCAAGVAALRFAYDHLRAYPGSTVLVIATELPTLTFQPEDFSADHLISCAIFGDGAAAVLLTDEPGPGFAIHRTASHFFRGTSDFMGFDLEETGFHIFLSRRIPRFMRETLMPAVQKLAPEIVGGNLPNRWLVHPGSSKILDAVEEALELPRGELTASREVLRRFGNLSSATIFFVIDEYLRSNPPAGERPAILAVGPGFQVDLVMGEITLSA